MRLGRIPRISSILLLCCLTLPLPGQDYQLPIARIDSLLGEYEGARPGYALGVVRGGELLYSAGYGMANLDYGIPLSDSSAVYIGSMAKQFTAAALLILEAEGKLDLDAPVRHYLPEFPDYGYGITLNQLVHHVSGVRETNSLQLFQGIDLRFEEVFDTDDLVELILAQEKLNFKPGTEYRYSSGGYAVLAKVIERVSGQTLRAFLGERVFKPLGMRNTFVCDNHNEIVPNRAVSYWPLGEGRFERRNQVFDAYGDGGIITTVRDLAKWDAAFYADRLGISDFAGRMYRKPVLGNGDTIDYARALNVWNYRGLPVVQHNGGMLGFRVDMLRFPTERTTIILLGNSAYLNPTGDALRIADILLAKKFANETALAVKNIPVVHPNSRESLEEYPGYYWSDDINQFRRISRSGDSLFFDRGSLAYKQYLRPVGEGEYLLTGADGTRLRFEAADSLTIRLAVS